MTIEAGPKPNGVRTAAADTRNQNNKTAANESPRGAFGAILASMDSSEMADPPIADAVDANASSKAVAVSTTPATTRTNSPEKSSRPPDASAPIQVGKGLDVLTLPEPEMSNEFGEAKKLLPEDPLDPLASTTLPVEDAAVVSTPTPFDLAATASSPVADPAAVSTATPTDAVEILVQASQRLSSNTQNSRSEGLSPLENLSKLGVAVVKSAQTGANPAGTSAGSLGLDAPLETPGKPGILLRDIAAKQVQTGDALIAKEPPAGREQESRSLQFAAKSVEQTTVPIAATLAAASSMTPMRREDPNRDRSIFRSNAAEGGAFGQAFLSNSASTAVQYTPELQTSPEVFVAEKVAYWISNDVQNAEMKLDGIGSDPVEVTIRMHGNEAHVAFRTDELQARAALENAGTHLKELLQREGLVLTGVSVGTAGAGDSGDREGKSRQGNRQTNIAVVSALPARSGAVVGRTTGGRLDLFV